ncbi:hypothetical protein VUR80DRAFT_9609 [Thermomyces stellatus]
MWPRILPQQSRMEGTVQNSQQAFRALPSAIFSIMTSTLGIHGCLRFTCPAATPSPAQYHAVIYPTAGSSASSFHRALFKSSTTTLGIAHSPRIAKEHPPKQTGLCRRLVPASGTCKNLCRQRTRGGDSARAQAQSTTLAKTEQRASSFHSGTSTYEGFWCHFAEASWRTPYIDDGLLTEARIEGECYLEDDREPASVRQSCLHASKGEITWLTVLTPHSRATRRSTEGAPRPARCPGGSPPEMIVPHPSPPERALATTQHVLPYARRGAFFLHRANPRCPSENFFCPVFGPTLALDRRRRHLVWSLPDLGLPTSSRAIGPLGSPQLSGASRPDGTSIGPTLVPSVAGTFLLLRSSDWLSVSEVGPLGVYLTQCRSRSGSGCAHPVFAEVRRTSYKCGSILRNQPTISPPHGTACPSRSPLALRPSSLVTPTRPAIALSNPKLMDHRSVWSAQLHPCFTQPFFFLEQPFPVVHLRRL